MQIFSKLQRNSFNQTFIRLVLIYFVNFLGSYTPFAPVMLGLFFLCESFYFSLLFLILFCYFHNFNVYYFVFVLFFYRYFILQKLKDVVDVNYHDAVMLTGVYFVLGAYLFYATNASKFLVAVYIVYNYAFDLVVMRFLKCEVK